MSGFFGRHKTFFFIVVMLFFAATPAFAGNPVTPILPSDNIQDPGSGSTAWGGCGPTDSNCYVTTTASQWITSGSNIYYNIGNVGIGDATPAALFTVGSGDLFQVDSSGAIVAATGITSSGSVTFSGLSTTGLVHNSSAGLLSTSLVAAADVTPDSLDFSELKDTMTLDATTNINANGFNFTFTNSANGTQFAVNRNNDGTNSFGMANTDPGTNATSMIKYTNNIGNTTQIINGGGGYSFGNNSYIIDKISGNIFLTARDGTGFIDFQTGGIGTGSSKMRVNGSGELMIGSTTDLGAYKLQLTGDANLVGNVTISTLASAGTQCVQASSTGVLSVTGSACGSGGSGVTTLAAIGSSPNANGATISGSILNLEPASASFGGVVTTGTQTFAGAKTFNSDVVANTITVGLGSGSVATTTALGYQAMNSSLTMNNSVAVGYQALKNAGQVISAGSMIAGNEYMIQTTGTTNYVAEQGASSNSPGTVFTAAAPGTGTGTVSPTEGNNVAVGYQALLANTYGTENIAIGGAALTSNTRGFENVAMGNGALYSSTTGSWNTALGGQSLQSVSTGSNNTAVGGSALNVVDGSDNTALGYNAGSNLTSGSNNIFIGSGVQPNISNTASNQLNIGNWIYGDNGRIGIGTATPASDTVLELRNNAPDVAPQLTLSNADTGNSYAQLRLKGSGNSWAFGVANSTETYFSMPNDFFIYDETADDIRFMINSGNGFVGIGDTTPDYKLDVALTTTDGNIFSLTDSDGECLHNPEAGSEVVSCSSDARLKTNITDTTSALSYFSDFQIRDYNIIASGDKTTGVIAQEMLLTHPELVSQDAAGMYSVQLPNQWKVIKAIQELDVEVKGITDLTESDDTSFVAHLRAWLANATNHITRIFTGEICLTDPDGTSECLNKTELHGLKQLLNTQSQPVVAPTPTPDPAPDQEPPTDESSDSTVDNTTTP